MHPGQHIVMTKQAEDFQTKTLLEHEWGEKVSRILASSLAAVDPASIILQSILREGDALDVAGRSIDLTMIDRVYLLAIGKAALPMGVTAADIIRSELTAGLIITKPGDQQIPDQYQDRLTLIYAGHPLPDQGSIAAGRIATELLSSLTSRDLVLTLISGGGSALFSDPLEGITLNDLQRTNQALLDCGATINEINTIRKHLSRVKGGQLARIISPAENISLILSDVMGDPLDMIASGPTVADPTTFQDAQDIVHKYNLDGKLPGSVLQVLNKGAAGDMPETPKPGDSLFKDQVVKILAANRDAIQGGLIQALKEGFSNQAMDEPLAGEASQAGKNLAQVLKQLAEGKPFSRPACLIAGGETTVTITPDVKPGLGGRNLELALSAVQDLSGLDNVALITLATDGEDGVTGAAGAIVTGSSYSRALELDLDPADYLKRHDSYGFFDALGDLLKPGATLTNVNDLCFLFAF
jgi:hydroxypyruvate reductase